MLELLLQVFDGHNGPAAAVFTKENLLNNVTSAVPSGLSRDEWLAALPRAMVAGFVKTDKDWQKKGTPYGTLRGRIHSPLLSVQNAYLILISSPHVDHPLCVLADAVGRKILRHHGDSSDCGRIDRHGSLCGRLSVRS